MKRGKVSDTILSRSVLKPVNTVRGKQVERLDIGQDAGEVRITDMNLGFGNFDNLLDNNIINNASNFTNNPSDISIGILTSTACGYMPLVKAVNNIYAAGGIPVGVSDCIIMDEHSREIRLREVIAGLTRQAAITGVPITGGHTTVSDTVSSPVVTVSATGIRENERKRPQPGQNIIMAGCIGMSGIRQLIDANSDKVYSMYSEDYIAKAYGEDTELYIGNIVNILTSNNIHCYMHDVSEGGIYGALWDMCEYGHTGLEVDIRSILVRQEIIEICELLNINPYELESMGCLLMTADDDCDIINVLNNHNIQASVIGRVTKGNKRILHNKDEERYLDLPKQDEVYRNI